MRQIESKSFEGFNDTLVERPTLFSIQFYDGRELTYDDVLALGIPAVTSTFDGKNNPQTIIGAQNEFQFWDETSAFPVGRMANYHRRNLEVLGDEVEIQDQYGSTYRSLCIKGSDFADPYIFKHDPAPRDYSFNGLQESLVIERVIRASNYLRSKAVRAEYICGLVMPKVFLMPNSQNGLDDHRSIDLPSLLESAASRFAEESKKDEDETSLEVKVDMLERFRDCNFLVTYRAMDCPFRALDIVNRFKDIRPYLAKNKQWDDVPIDWDEVGRTRYFCGVFAAEIGCNVGSMHKNGIYHGFLTPTNLSAMGAIVDLDSCKGEPLELGDDPISLEQITTDILSVFDSLSTIAHYLDNNQDDEQLLIQSAYSNFLHAYFETAEFSSEKKDELLVQILKKAAYDHDIDDRYLNFMASALTESYFIGTNQDDGIIPVKLPHTVLDAEAVEQYNNRFGFLPPLFFNRDLGLIKDSLQSFSEEMQGGIRKYLYTKTFMSLYRLGLRSFIVANLTDDNISDPREILQNVGFYAGKTPLNEDQIEASSQIHNHCNKVLTHFVEHIAKPDYEKLSPEIVNLIIEHKPDFLDRVGQLAMDFEDLTTDTVPTLYLKTQREYRDFISYLRKKAVSVEFDVPEPEDFEDSLLVADYRYISIDKLHNMHPDQEDKIPEFLLFDSFINRRPSILVIKASSDHPRIKIIANSLRAGSLGIRSFGQQTMLSSRTKKIDKNRSNLTREGLFTKFTIRT